jgi:mono/diheme cytochrome c family protein
MLAAFIGLSFAGCVSLQAVADKGWDGAQAARRGRVYADAQCASCHARGPGPAFAKIATQYSPDMLTREFEVIGEVGHYGMAARLIPVQNRSDLAAYIASLAPAAPRLPLKS